MVWFRDGTRLLASGVGPAEHGEATGIWIINLLTATPRQILGNAEGAVPSPDGTQVSFRNSTAPQIEIVNAAGENARVLATAALHENFGQLQWSPDGKKVGVIVRRIGESEGTIDSIDVESGKRTEIARVKSPRSFVWLDDGRLIISSAEGETGSETLLHEIDSRGGDTPVSIGAGSTVAQISATADGKKLVLVRKNEQSDAYVGVMGPDEKITNPRRITLDDRDDLPTGWLKDGQTILFSSARNGTLDVFRQQIESLNADQMAAGPGQQFGAEALADGKTVLYWSVDEGSKTMRLMSMPSAGGPAETVLEAPLESSFHCASAVPTCVLSTRQGTRLQFSSFNGHDSKLTPLRSIDADPQTAVWAIAGDGSSIAVGDKSGFRVVELASGQGWSIPTEKLTGQISGVGPGATASSWLLTTTSVRENGVLLANRSGVRVLQSAAGPLSSPRLAPDGKHVVFGLTSTSSNAWLIENF